MSQSTCIVGRKGKSWHSLPVERMRCDETARPGQKERHTHTLLVMG
jgi:hypothetical protein